MLHQSGTRAIGSGVHPRFDRRTALQAGAIGLLGLGSNHLAALHSLGANTNRNPSARAVIYIFLSGGLSQHDSFDMKPDAAAEIRGEFSPVSTSTPGLQICEHLPELAKRSHLWSVCRSLTHNTNDHSLGHNIMLTGQTPAPPGFNGSKPMPGDWPSLASIAGALTPPRNNLPPAAVLPERLVHYSGRVIPGQFGGQMGAIHDPWFIEASPFDGKIYGAYPEYGFDHEERPGTPTVREFQAPSLTLPQGVSFDRLGGRLGLLNRLDEQRRDLERTAAAENFDRYRQGAVSLLTDPKIKAALDVVNTDPKTLDRYGRNTFGWSLLMARRLVETGVNLVQVNLGNNETWDTHGNSYPHLKDKLFPPADRSISALLDDLHESGMLENTLIVMAGEFGRTPRLSLLPQFYKTAGRDHWGALQTIFFAGGGTRGGRAVGSSDKIGAYPETDPQKPENMAATIYHCLGLPETIAWHDETGRPHHIYQGDPIAGLF